ncbi:hypothetical protein DPMN_035631 [Dreissena polymorpha]|uniref:Uncharacterized protein n=1 Tax=Dreissena polymorpha TaxID=45954 RepID=A0A9D4RN62_DREPO|nr:hypothetical protein DPMN_035631 [Dreissena polymorpha]
MATSENVKNVCLQRNKEFSDIEKEFVTQVSKGPYSHKYRAQNLQVVKVGIVSVVMRKKHDFEIAVYSHRVIRIIIRV